MKSDTELIALFRRVVKNLGAQHRMLADAEANEGLLHAYKAVIRHLDQLPDRDVVRLLNATSKKQPKEASDDLTPLAAAMLTLNEIERILNDPETSRRTLELIAQGRFQVPKGSMRSYGNIAALREKVSNMVQNERVHEVISSVAKNPPGSTS